LIMFNVHAVFLYAGGEERRLKRMEENSSVETEDILMEWETARRDQERITYRWMEGWVRKLVTLASAEGWKVQSKKERKRKAEELKEGWKSWVGRMDWEETSISLASKMELPASRMEISASRMEISASRMEVSASRMEISASRMEISASRMEIEGKVQEGWRDRRMERVERKLAAMSIWQEVPAFIMDWTQSVGQEIPTLPMDWTQSVGLKNTGSRKRKRSKKKNTLGKVRVVLVDGWEDNTLDGGQVGKARTTFGQVSISSPDNVVRTNLPEGIVNLGSSPSTAPVKEHQKLQKMKMIVADRKLLRGRKRLSYKGEGGKKYQQLDIQMFVRKTPGQKTNNII
jgi:hypothetical protein